MNLSSWSLNVQFNAFHKSYAINEIRNVADPWFKIILHGLWKLSEEPRHVRIGTAIIFSMMATISIPQSIWCVVFNTGRTSCVTRFTIVVIINKSRWIWSRCSSTRTVIIWIITIITESYSICPHMLARITKCYWQAICIVIIDWFSIMMSWPKSIRNSFLITFNFTTDLVESNIVGSKDCRVAATDITPWSTHYLLGSSWCSYPSPSRWARVSFAGI